MAVSNLAVRLAQANLTAEQFADIVGVDPKTVQRWLGGRVPYRRHRATIARALDTTEHALWPDDIPAPQAGPPPVADAPAVSSHHAAATLEQVGVVSHLDDPDAPDPGELIAEGDGPVDVLDSSGWVTIDDHLASVLVAHASAERPVRIVCGEPTQTLRPLIGHPHITIRITDGWSAAWVLRVGDTIHATLTPLLDTDPPPLLVVQRASAVLTYTRLVDDFEDLWQRHDNDLVDPDQLIDADEQDLDAEHAPSPDPDPADPGEPPRRWPGRRPGDGEG